jgi:hypothetical protein
VCDNEDEKTVELEIQMILNPCPMMSRMVNACSAPVCFRKTMTARIGSAVAFVSSGITPFAPVSKVKFSFQMCESSQENKSLLRSFLLFIFSAYFYLF